MTHAPAITNEVIDPIQDTLQSQLELSALDKPETSNVVDSISRVISVNYNELLIQQLKLLESVDGNGRSITAKEMLDMQEKVSGITVKITLVSKLTSMGVKNLDTLLHTQ